MAKRDLPWVVRETIDVTNNSNENILLDLPGGLLRVDKGRTVRLVAHAAEQDPVKALLDGGKLTITSRCKV